METMTKESLLLNQGEAYEYSHRTKVTPVVDAYKAMDEYAKQEAIEFAKFTKLINADYDFGEEMWWIDNSISSVSNEKSRWATDEEIYELYIQSKNK